MATGDKKKAVMQFDIDTASLSNDATHVPSSPLVKSALDALMSNYKFYFKKINGVTYTIAMFGKLGVFSIYTGSLTEAVSANATLVSLTDFSSDFTGATFMSTYQNIYTTNASKRFSLVIGNSSVVTVDALAAGFSPRGTCVFVLA